ncbi:SAM-dependent methyltransferase [Euryhalocaulis caribicus]|uniref:SAM-dependent methyltransferase n=1 Tax=Euryhalocaulis caribicus TaxID=1161401 RepID=UPI0003A9DF4D|nr:SAM-dependent methyltransferase [Euryhalocaulis caribicus]
MTARGNTSTAVMNRRVEPADSLDYFPTPPWAARAFCALALGGLAAGRLQDRTCWEPCCGEGHMASALQESFARVFSSDIHPYGAGRVHDFAHGLPQHQPRPDWIVTNPPFNRFLEFALHAMTLAEEGVALLGRTTVTEGGTRFKKLYSPHAPNAVFQYAERVPMTRGKYDPTVGSATAYAWLVWMKDPETGAWGVPLGMSRWTLIPPCRKRFERLPADAGIGKPFAPRERQGGFEFDDNEGGT